MADKKISALTAATTPLAGTEVLPIVQSSTTKKVATDDLTVKNIRSNATTGILQIAGPAASSTRTMTVPDANFTAARTDAAQSFTGDQTFSTGNLIQGTAGKGLTTGGSFDLGLGANGSTSAVYVNTSNKLLVNTNSNGFSAYCAIKQTVAANDTLSLWNSATSGNNVFVGFFTDGGTGRGSIDYDRAGGLVRYNTTSDYRAKDIIGPVQNVGATIDALKVYEGVMKGATRSRPMLIAHEAQEHVPYAVSGVKDDVKDDGSPRLQQIDVSSLVPLLLAEIQLLRARVATLEQQFISKG